ncbi:F0F1 ATP synthase subunit A [Cellulomonas sp. PhB143]|uniref:F0F1 ATP synthase subunit A n=1 Tax=Cellulomonas sp. PhB143 TaxID=2485186 RepID=UPI000F9DB321|nr:F0F1 ATP synthase subunit A [Cellulomonas sp. PhB143]ROS78472.1 ATP synthase F0 subcomplex A subunit [Cellulomonas sp. PhB143]
MFTLATTQILAAESDGFHAPSISDFFPPAIFFDGTAFEINRIMLVRFIAAIALLTIFVIGARRAKLVPGRFQNLLELGLDFCRRQITYEILGEQLGKKYVPLITTIFFAVFFFNVTGIVPFLNVAGTSVIGLPIIFALWVFVMYLAAGFKRFGFGGFFKHALFPPGVPKVLYLLLTPVEFLQVFLLRPATLVIRLFANMLAGHLLLALCFAATSYLFFEASGAIKVAGVVTLAGGFAFFLLEAFVAALQAYVFAILTAVYIQMSVEAEH